jgi:hypothetical protein
MTRLIATVALAVCLMLAIASSAFALSGPGGGGVTAAAAQYPVTAPSTQQPSLGGTSPTTGTSPTNNAPGNVKAEATPSANTPSANAPSAAQQPRQVTATGSGSSLPFTGFAALAVLGFGVALLLGGLTLRRATVS